MVLLFSTFSANAAEYFVEAKNEALIKTLKIAKSGDILRLASGTHKGPIIINVALTIEGEGKAKIEGNGKGSVILINAANVTISGLEISGSGSNHENNDAGVRALETAKNTIVQNNKIIKNLIGVNLHGAGGSLVINNYIEGRQDHRMNDRGNGVYIWNAPGAKVIGNDFLYGRDGIFVNVSTNNIFTKNRFQDLRFAVHYMYTHDSEVIDNISIGNHLGYAIMNSNNVIVKNNFSLNDRDHGIMLNYTNKSIFSNNIIRNVKEKCVFIYNSHKNTLKYNKFERCNIGIHFTAGSEKNKVFGNAFLYNRTQVKYVGTKWVDWSFDGVGNYWSDHASYDLDANGIADSIYRPNDVMDRILWTQPAAKSLIGSPAVQLIKWSQSTFPALLPGGVVDKSPMMHPIEIKDPVWSGLN